MNWHHLFNTSIKHLASSLCLSLLLLVTAESYAISITEIHYNPLGSEEVLEFVELMNDTSTPEDLSGYYFSEGIDFNFPAGTILPAHGIIVLVKDEAAFSAAYPGVTITGIFQGQLDNSGDRITLVNQSGIELQSVDYEDSGRWPIAPDGTGHTLSIKNIHLPNDESESWAQSLELGGTPGSRNFPSQQAEFIETEIVRLGVTWRYLKGSSPLPADWRALDLDDSSWLSGPTGIGYSDGDDATVLSDMQNNYASVAARHKFTLTQEQLEGDGTFHLAINYDDGFCAYLNEEEIGRRFCGTVGQDHPWNTPSTGVREADGEEVLAIPHNFLQEGENILAIVVHNQALNSSDLSLLPRVIKSEVLSSSAQANLSFNEFFRGDDPWVEIFNPQTFSVDISDHNLMSDAGSDQFITLPADTVVPARGFLTIDLTDLQVDLLTDRVRFFLLSTSGISVAAGVFNRMETTDPDFLTASESKIPDGVGRLQVAAVPTPGEANVIDVIDHIVINELFYHPPGGRGDEYIEIYNRSNQAQDLTGFRFTRGIDYDFADGTTIDADAYLVIAKDPTSTQRNHSLGSVLGPYEGQLADGGERVRFVDPRGNTVDEIRYQDGGQWPGLADGGGSSIELVDAFQDNSFGSAWAASDESDKSTWELKSFNVPSYRTGPDSELHLFMVEGGICLVDDISITRNNGSNHIPNPGFETGTNNWVIQGTHIHSRRVTYDAHSGSACLELNASGAGDTLVNRIETNTSPGLSNGPYEVSLWARWIQGGNQLIAHGEFSSGAFAGGTGPSGNLSGNPMQGRLTLSIPPNLGTAGAVNSRTIEHQSNFGDTNQGPVIADAQHTPPLPLPGSTVKIEARVSDSDGVDQVYLHYRFDSAGGVFNTQEIFDNGISPDAIAGDGIYSGNILAGADNQRLVYYVEAIDDSGRTGLWPKEAPDRTFMFMADDSGDHARIETYRLFLDTARTQELSSRALHSNDLLDGTFVFNHEQAYYQIGFRYRGSPWGRPGRTNYRVRFNKDDRFHRESREINLSSRASRINEGAAHFLQGRVANGAIPAPVADYLYCRTSFQGGGQSTFALIQPVNSSYIEKWFGSHEDHQALKAIGRMAFNDQGTMRTWDGAAYTYRLRNQENYRGFFKHVTQQSLDRWDRLMDLFEVMDATESSNTVFDANVEDQVDLAAFLRVITPLKLTDGWDAFSVGHGHNGYLVYDGVDGLWNLLPFDMDNSFRNAGISLFSSQDPDISRMLGRPLIRRIYLGILNEYFQGYWDSSRASPWLDQLQRDVGHNPSGIKSFIQSSKNTLGSTVSNAVNSPLEITNNSGEDFFVEEFDVVLNGTAPVSMQTLLLTIGDGQPTLFEPRFISQTRWRGTIQVEAGENPISLLGFNSEGDLLGSDEINIIHTAGIEPPFITDYSPKTGSANGGEEIVFEGVGFNDALSVKIGEKVAFDFDIVDDTELRIGVPPAAFPFSGDGKVDITIEFISGEPLVIEDGFTYVLNPGFIRGDATNDDRVNLGDAIGILHYLYLTGEVECRDAADFNDSGRIEMSDAIGLLNFLFLNGEPPTAPFPFPGRDPSPDPFGC